MPTGQDPPRISLSSSVFSSLHSMSYDANQSAFVSQNTYYYMFVEKQAQGDAGQWFYGTDSDGGINPRGNIPQATANVILGGSYDSQTTTVMYQNSSYKFRLERENGVHVVRAYV